MNREDLKGMWYTDNRKVLNAFLELLYARGYKWTSGHTSEFIPPTRATRLVVMDKITFGSGFVEGDKRIEEVFK